MRLNWAMKCGLLGVLLFLNSCGLGPAVWSEKDQAALSSVAVAGPVVAADAYRDPVGHESAMAPVIIVPGAGIDTAIGMNAGVSLFAGSISAAQQSSFEERYGASFDAVRSKVPSDLDGMLYQATTKRLRQHSFFGPRLTSASSNALTIKIKKHSLQRCGKRGDEILVSPTLSGGWTLKAGNRVMASGSIFTASPSQQRTVTEFARNPSALRAGYAEAADRAAHLIVAELENRMKSVFSSDRTRDPVPDRKGYAKWEGSTQNMAAINGFPALKAAYDFGQSINRYTMRPKPTYGIGNDEFKIAHTADGGVLYVVPTKGMAKVGNAAYHNLRQALEKGGVRIARDRQFSLGIMPAGYVLELTGNGIAALAPYRKD